MKILPEYGMSNNDPLPNPTERLQFRPSKTTMMVMGFFVVFGGLVLCFIGYVMGYWVPNSMKTAFSSVSSVGASPEEGLDIIFKVYLGVGVFLGALGLGVMVLGVGSIAARRWARALLLAVGWLLVGICGLFVLSMVCMIPVYMSTFSAASSGVGSAGGPSMGMFVIIGMVVQLVILIVAIGGPGVLLIFIYKSLNVKMTAEHFQQKPSWTDRVPTPVLVLWLTLVICILYAIPLLFGPIDFSVKMGLIPSNAVGYGILVAWVVVLAVLAFGISRMMKWSWFGVVLLLVACAGLGFYFNQKWDMESYLNLLGGETAGLDNEFDDQLVQMQEQSSRAGLMASGVMLLALLGYLFWIRKHFFPAKGAELTTAS